ncbi:MAG: glycosyltransferase family 39 protein [Dehalococcoidia bacterium]
MTQGGDQPFEPRRRALWPVALPPEVAPPPPPGQRPEPQPEPPRGPPEEPPPDRPSRPPAEPLSAGPFGTLSRGALIAIGLFILLNATLLGLYLWSQGGQHYQVRIEVRGDQFAAYLDGRLQVDGMFQSPEEGGIAITLVDTEALPSLPTPRGLDRVRVTDLTTGAVLFEDDFSDAPSPEWVVLGDFSVDQGVLSSNGTGILQLTNRPWRDYAVDAYFANAGGGVIAVRSDAQGNRVDYSFRPFRHFDNGFGVVREGSTMSGKAGVAPELGRSETVKGIAYMFLHPYPLMLLLLAIGFAGVLVLQLLLSFVTLPRFPAPPRDLPWALMALLAAAAFGVTLYLNYSFGSHVPHVPDEVAYLYQAKIFASGRLTGPAPPVDEVFNFFYPSFFLISDGHWSSIYTFGNSAVLAPGVLVGAPWLIPPLLGAGTVAFSFAIGRKLYGARVGLLAAALLASSPFFLMSAASFMSHNTTAFFLLASLFFVIISDRRPVLYGLVAGLSFGMMFNTRPLESAALIPAFGVLLLARAIPQDGRENGARALAGFVAGGLIMLAAYVGYNVSTSGELFKSNLQQQNDYLFGLGGEHSIRLAIQNEHLQTVFLLLVLHGWPVFIGLGFVLLPLILASKNPWDWFLIACVLLIMASYLTFQATGIMHGPRYWYPAAPLMMLLTARGADRAAQLLSDAAAYVRQRRVPEGDAPRWSGIAVVYPVVIALIAVSVNGWLLGHERWWADEFVPARAVDLKGFNGVDDRLVTLLDESDLSNAIVLVENCAGWQCYGPLFWRNTVTFDGDVVIARDLPQYLGPLLDAYPGRRVYVMSYGKGTIAPYGTELAVPGVPISQDDQSRAPLAKDVPHPTAAPTPTPNVVDVGSRDQQRKDALAAVAEALATYRDRHGTYPVSRGLQSLCRYQDLDAGCKLLEVLDPLPRDPVNSGDYYYESDGTSFVIYAILEEVPGDRGPCPDRPAIRPDDLPRLYCVGNP